MKKNFSSLALIGCLVLLVSWYAFYEKKYKVAQVEKDEQDKLLLTLPREQIQEIEIGRVSDTLKLKKLAENKWMLLAPLEDQADEGTVGSMLTTLSTTKQEREVEAAPKDLEPFGLKTPRLKLTIRKDGGGEPQEIWVGSDTPTGFSVYAKLAKSDKVYKVNKILFTTFDKTIFEVRNKNILNTLRTDIAELELQTAKENVILKSDDKSAWTLARDGMPADSAEASKLISALTDLRAGSIASEKGDKLDSFALTRPAVKITLTYKEKDKPRVSLLVGKGKDNIFVKRDDKPTVYVVDKASLEKLDRTSESLRDKHLAGFNRFDVKHVRLELASKETIDLTRKDGSWQLADAKAEEKVDTAKMDRLLTKLQDVKVARFVPLKSAAAALAKPEMTIRLFESKNEKETEVAKLVFGASGAEVTGHREGVPMAFQLKGTDFQELKVSRADLLEKPAKEDKPKESKG